MLSRLRAFAFSGRTPEQEQSILTRLFQVRGEEPGGGLGDYFQAFETQKKGLYDELARNFLEGLAFPVYPLDTYGKFWSEENNFALFLEALSARLRSEAGSRSLAVQESCSSSSKTPSSGATPTTWAQPSSIETLFYRAA